MKITITAEDGDDGTVQGGEVIYEGVPRCLIIMGANEKWLHATGKVDMIRADLTRTDQHFVQIAMIGAVQQAVAQMNQIAAERQQTAAILNTAGKRIS